MKAPTIYTKSKFIQITTGMYDQGGARDFVLYALDDKGRVWYFNQESAQWHPMSTERTGVWPITRK